MLFRSFWIGVIVISLLCLSAIIASIRYCFYTLCSSHTGKRDVFSLLRAYITAKNEREGDVEPQRKHFNHYSRKSRTKHFALTPSMSFFVHPAEQTSLFISPMRADTQSVSMCPYQNTHTHWSALIKCKIEIRPTTMICDH